MTTQYNAERVRNAAINLDNILADRSAFGDSLTKIWPNAGKFDRAVWLERIVGDRRDAIDVHVNHLYATFEKMAVQLKSIADTFQNLDGENAKKVKDLLGQMQTQLESEWRSWDENTEKTWQNYSTGPGNNNKPGDGDGFNDNLNDTRY